jgi:AcrR family transcriptional regulator
MTEKKPVVRRDAKATETRILTCAIECFSQAKYDEVGVRQIAAKAQVDPALINRYFGSKEELYAAVLLEAAKAMDLKPVLEADLSSLGEELATLMFLPESLSCTMLYLRAAVSCLTADIFAQSIGEVLIAPLAEKLDRQDGSVLANLLVGTCIGVAMNYYLLKVEPYASFAPEEAAAVLGKMLQSGIDESA